MEKFLISSDDCLILKAFKESSSLREAAKSLNRDPAGLARRVQTISTDYGFLQKINGRWSLTPSGLDLVVWTEESIQSQAEALAKNDRIRIGSTMWFAEEVLVPNLPTLQKELTRNCQIQISTPSHFERALLEGNLDFVIVCHPPETPEIEHKQIAQEEWVVIIPTKWTIKEFAELLKRPFIRHRALNTDLFFSSNLSFSDLEFDNLISIRSAVARGLGWSVVPRLCVDSYLTSGIIKLVNYKVDIHDRRICLWWLRSRRNLKKKSSLLNTWLSQFV